MCISFLKRFVAGLPKNRIFTTRDVLIFGSRTAVDQSLRRLVKAEYIVRLARGVFIKDGSQPPSALAVAQAKCRAFGKQLTKHGAELASELGLMDNPNIQNVQTVFAQCGHTSQFWYGNILIKLKGISPRKMLINKLNAGHKIAAFWYLGRKLCQPEQIVKTIKRLSYEDREQLRNSRGLVPDWIGHFCKKFLFPIGYSTLDLMYQYILGSLVPANSLADQPVNPND